MLGSLEKSRETGVQGFATTAASDGCGTSQVIINGATAYSHVAAAYSPDIRYGNYSNTHHLAAAHGPHVGSNFYSCSTIIDHHNTTSTRSCPADRYDATF
uniref:Uncharacterized protein n=1 Tax=Romanomermis culicivorax TaxID=13658 RepID=A0A915JGW2_ROMCU